LGLGQLIDKIIILCSYFERKFELTKAHKSPLSLKHEQEKLATKP